MRLEFVRGDITTEAVDAIVNAANAGLAGGGGVDGAVHRAGGPAIMAACRVLGGCDTGDAVATAAGLLAARHVIHAVGPVWRDGTSGEPELLASAYRRAIEVAAGLGCRSVAIPAISTGIYGFPGRGPRRSRSRPPGRRPSGLPASSVCASCSSATETSRATAAPPRRWA